MVRHRRRMAPADVWSAAVALLLLAAGLGLMAYLLLTIPTGTPTTP